MRFSTLASAALGLAAGLASTSAASPLDHPSELARSHYERSGLGGLGTSDIVRSLARFPGGEGLTRAELAEKKRLQQMADELPSLADQAPFLQVDTQPSADANHKVLVTLGVMSRCPDAFLMESLIDEVLADYKLAGKVDLELIYIGSLDETEPTGVACKHGQIECTGNVQQLCAQKHLDQAVWWRFVTCQDYYSSRIGTKGLAEQCADVAGFEWADLKSCAEGDEGARLLRDSVKRVHELGVEKSATFLLGEEHKVRCIHDSDWKACDDGHSVHDFVRSILQAWEDKL